MARHSKSNKCEEIEKENTFPNWFVKFTLIPSDVGELYLELVTLSKYVDDNLEPDDPFEFGDLIADFEDEIKEKDEDSVLFPDLLEAYRRYVAMHTEDDEPDWE